MILSSLFGGGALPIRPKLSVAREFFFYIAVVSSPSTRLCARARLAQSL